MIEVRLICDRCGEGTTPVYSTDTVPRPCVPDALEAARLRGWCRARLEGETSRDLCPRCREECRCREKGADDR